MSLASQISDDLKTAMKAKDKLRTSVLRMVLSELKYASTDGANANAVDDATASKIVSTYHKRLEKSLSDYPEGDKTSQIRLEMAIVSGYLPKKAGESETLKVIEALLAESEDRNFGKLMKSVLSKLGDAADGKLVSSLLKKQLEKDG